MKKSAMLSNILQTIIPNEEVLPYIKQVGYDDSARKFTVNDLFLFLSQAALMQELSIKK